MRNFSTKFGRQKASSRRRGIVLIEFYFAFVGVLLPLCLALIQYGVIIQTTLAMENLSREAGRFASIKSRNATDGDAELKQYVVDNAAGMGIKVLPANVTVNLIANTATVKTNRVRYQPITVTIKYNMSQKSFMKKIFNIPVFQGDYTTQVMMIMQ